MSVGVRPENKLAVEAGLEIGKRGGIRVNEHANERSRYLRGG